MKVRELLHVFCLRKFIEFDRLITKFNFRMNNSVYKQGQTQVDYKRCTAES